MRKQKSKVLTGVVIRSNISTLVVVVGRTIKHKLYEKIIRKTKKYAIHNPGDIKCQLGSKIKFKECRPISKTKAWILV